MHTPAAGKSDVRALGAHVVISLQVDASRTQDLRGSLHIARCGHAIRPCVGFLLSGTCIGRRRQSLVHVRAAGRFQSIIDMD